MCVHADAVWSVFFKHAATQSGFLLSACSVSKVPHRAIWMAALPHGVDSRERGRAWNSSLNSEQFPDLVGAL